MSCFSPNLRRPEGTVVRVSKTRWKSTINSEGSSEPNTQYLPKACTGLGTTTAPVMVVVVCDPRSAHTKTRRGRGAKQAGPWRSGGGGNYTPHATLSIPKK